MGIEAQQLRANLLELPVRASVDGGGYGVGVRDRGGDEVQAVEPDAIAMDGKDKIREENDMTIRETLESVVEEVEGLEPDGEL